jgi:hypothetical protein
MQRQQDLRGRISRLPDDRLLHMLAEGRGEHGRPAIHLAAAELMRRGVSLPPSLYQPAPPAQPVPGGRGRAGRDELERGRKDTLEVFLCCCAALAFSAWNLYDSGRSGSRASEDKLSYLIGAMLLVPLMSKIYLRVSKKLLDKE